jgi:hypothetical protein
MKWLLQYHFVYYLRTYKYVLPLSVYILTLVVNYVYKPKTILDSYSFTSLVLFFIMGWFTVTVFHAEDEGQKWITLLHCKRSRDYYIALFTICDLIGLCLSFVSVFYPIVFDMFGGKTRPLHVVIGIMDHFSLSILAIALSAIFTRDLVKNKGNTWWGVLSILIISVAISSLKSTIMQIKGFIWFLPPVHLSLEMMSSGDMIKSIPSLFYLQFGWIFFYGILFILLFFLIIKLKRIS